MCPKTSKTTPLLLIGGIVFVIILVAITGVTLINNINLSNIIRLNEQVASDSVSANDNHIKELNYVNNHPRNVYAKQLNETPSASSEPIESGDGRSMEQIRNEMSSAVAEPKLLAVIGRDGPRRTQTLDELIETPPLAALPFGGARVTPSAANSLIDDEKRAQIVKVSGAWGVCSSSDCGLRTALQLRINFKCLTLGGLTRPQGNAPAVDATWTNGRTDARACHSRWAGWLSDWSGWVMVIYLPLPTTVGFRWLSSNNNNN